MNDVNKNEKNEEIKNEMKNCEKIRLLYVMSGLTQKQLSQITGIKMNTIMCWVSGRRNPPDHVVEWFRSKIAQYKQSNEETENETTEE